MKNKQTSRDDFAVVFSIDIFSSMELKDYQKGKTRKKVVLKAKKIQPVLFWCWKSWKLLQHPPKMATSLLEVGKYRNLFQPQLHCEPLLKIRAA